MTARFLRALVIAVVVAACSGSPGSPGTGVGATTGPTGGASASPAVPAPGTAPLPAPTLTDPAVIGTALLDPDRAADGVVSLVALLGIGIYRVDGSAVRAGAGTSPTDPWLYDVEVLGLIELAKADAASLRAGAAPTTLGAFATPIAGLLPGTDAASVLATYAAAYAATPTRTMASVAGSIAWSPDTPTSRALAWFLLFDGLFGSRAGATALAGPQAVTAALGGPPAIAVVPAGGPVLPQIPSPDPRLSIQEWNLLIAQLPLLGNLVPFDVSPGSARGHEGHGGPGDTLTFDAKWVPNPVPLVSPFGGTPLLLPTPFHMDGLPITWQSADEATLRKHGSPSVPFGTPMQTDATGIARLTYAMREETANGKGTELTATPSVMATVEVRDLVTAMYIVPPALLGFLAGRRTAIAVADLSWHEDIALELEINSTVTPILLNAFSVPDGSATAIGRIRLHRDGDTGPWSGDGTLASTTASDAGGCMTMEISGQGSYDWRVFKVTAGPEVTTAADIGVDMDSGPINEQPDSYTANACQTSFSGTMNTWENLWFTTYRHRYASNGFHVGAWALVATPDTWTQGGLVATAKWTGSCDTNLDETMRKVMACTDVTTFKLWAVVP